MRYLLLFVDGGVQFADRIFQCAHAGVCGGVLLTQGVLHAGVILLDLRLNRRGLVRHTVVAVNLIPVVAVALRVLLTVQLLYDAEVVSDGLVGVDLLNLPEARQVGVRATLCFEDFNAALRSKYVFQVSSSFRCCRRMTLFSSRIMRSPSNSIR